MGPSAKAGSPRLRLCHNPCSPQNPHSANSGEVPVPFENFKRKKKKSGDTPIQKENEQICTSFIKTEVHLEFQATDVLPGESFLIGEHEKRDPEKVGGA